MASPERVRAATATDPGSVGPVGLKCRVYADHSALALADFVCGANAHDEHLTGVNWDRDVQRVTAADLRNVVEGDPSPTGKGTTEARPWHRGRPYLPARQQVQRAHEGHGARRGRPRDRALLMGCYGIGVTRIVAAAIEQNHDERGIIWPDPIAPFQVVLVPLNLQKSTACPRSRRPAVRRAHRRRHRGALRRPRRAARASSSPTPSCSASRTAWWSASAAWRRAGSNTARRRDSASTEFPQDEALAFMRGRLGG